MQEIATAITDELSLGEHLYPDVYQVVLGKLLDKEKLLGHRLKGRGILVDIGYLTTQVKNVMERFIHTDFQILKETADYYRIKYPG